MQQTEIATKEQAFTFHDVDALSVLLVGDFTHWEKEPISLHKNAHGFWNVSVPLPPGIYHYRFLVDGQRREEPDYILHVD